CLSLDLLYQAYPKWQKNIWALSLVAGLSYSLIPVFRFIIGLITGMVFPSLLTGLAYPFFTHLLFGMTGALIAAGVIKATRSK
ncbi:MAG: hypothetical protein JEZ03_13155, partial [Bacteroidales bacterium]|nr:hypothetical protein [Bacteroidales bacterium]